MPKFLQSTKFQLGIIILLTILAYSNIFQNNFMFDDKFFVIDWKINKNFNNIKELFLYDSVMPGVVGYRPVRGIFYILGYAIYGENPLGWHINSIIIHILCTVLVYFITKELIQNAKFKVQNFNSKLKSNKKIINHYSLFSIPFITALLFGLHPIHTEAITFITASMDSIGFLFLLLSFYLYQKGGKKLYLLSLICTFIA